MKFLILISLCFLAPNLFAQAPVKKHISPSASEILDSMVKQTILVRQEIYAAVQGLSPTVPAADVLSGNLKFALTMDLTTNPRTIKITLQPASGTGYALDPANNPLAASLKKLTPLAYPAVAADITAGQWRANAVPTNLNAAVLEAFNYCKDKIIEVNTEFWFEMMPLHLYCHAVSLPNLNSYSEILSMGAYADATNAVIGATEYDKYRLKVAGELAIGAVIHQAHLEIQKSPAYMKNKARCFPLAPKKFVQTVIASMVVPFKYAVDGGPGIAPRFDYGPVGMMAMPEGNYALGAAAKYYADDKPTIFNNAPPMVKTMASVADAPSIRFSTESYKTFAIDADGVLHFEYKVRDLDSPTCVGIFFCNNKPAPPLLSPLQGG